MTRSPAIPSDCDVVVLGGGMGGLTSAVTLAKAGLDVCVLEMDSRPGGYLAGFKRNKFTFDTAIHWLNQCGESGMTRRIFDYLGPGAPQTPKLTRIRRYLNESTDYLLTEQPEQLLDTMVRDFPQDAPGIRSFFGIAEKVGRHFRRVCQTVRTPLTMSWLERGRLMLPAGLAGLSMLRHSGPAHKALPRFFKSERLRDVFCAERDFLSCVVPISWAYEGDYQLPPVGGSQEFPRWLCRRLDDLGATTAFHSRVDEILCENERVRGVRFTHRHRGVESVHEIRCRHVVATNDLHTLYSRMLPPGTVPPKLVRRIDRADLYDSSVTLSIGLDCPTGELGFGEEMTVLSRTGIPRREHCGADPSKVSLSILAPSLRDPTLAPEGKGTLVIYAPARIDQADHWKTGPDLERGADYRRYKADFATTLIDRVGAAIAPELRSHIEVCDVATPVTHQRYTGNKDGTIMAARPTGRNIFRRVAQYRTPIRNLILGGHWAEYGGGVPVAVRAGFNSALLILQRERPSTFEAIKGLADGTVRAAEIDPTGE